ncbi:MAG: glycosidase ph1107-related protein [Parcubacteria bacterium C7867-005]|nr:MAG: glycosidase ph1107-related protein [Parcubacteria bacterium C7867-005]
MFTVTRSAHNPILIPSNEHHWEAFATFNPCPIKHGKKIHMLYRAISFPDVLSNPKQRSVIGVAESLDGKYFAKHAPFIEPEEEWERFGCEDPRITHFEGSYYTFYTALSKFPFEAEGIKAAVAVSSDCKKVKERHLVTPFNAKAMTLFSERIGGKVTVLFSAYTDSPPTKMVIVQVDKIEDLWSEETWKDFGSRVDDYRIDLKRTEYDHVEVGAPPIKTKYGWLLIYSYIQNYFPNPDNADRIFGVEAVLLDLHDPRKIIGKTHGPLLVPNEPYELTGHVGDIVFPTGTLLDGDMLEIFYGAADTTGCSAKVSLIDLISSIYPETAPDWHLKRFVGNPTIIPNPGHAWEAQATLNPGAIHLKGTTHIFYRAISNDNTSTVGYATTKDGLNIDRQFSEPIYVPREPFEMKKIDNCNSGCEDGRITKIDDRIYMCYTAFDGIGPPQVAVTSILEKDFLNHSFNWTPPKLLTPRGIDDKDACILPEKIGKKYLVLHRIGTDICGDYMDSLDFTKDKVNTCIRVLGPRSRAWDSVKVGIAAPPIKTKKGWLLLYHAISRVHHTYRVGAALLDLKDPTIVLARSSDPIFEPEEQYEKIGLVNNVVFPCGMVEKDGLLYVYYGGADKVCGVATMKMDILLSALTRS